MGGGGHLPVFAEDERVVLGAALALSVVLLVLALALLLIIRVLISRGWGYRT